MIKPIQTIYKGYKFRSRLEARWAVFFEACGADWEYEPEGFDLGDEMYYLPDFLLHNVDCRSGSDIYVEVKGQMTELDAEKIERFVRIPTQCHKGCMLPSPLIVVGRIPNGQSWYELACDMYGMHDGADGAPFFGYDTLDGDAYPAFMAAAKRGGLMIVGPDHDQSGVDEKRTIEAYNTARQSRFEHGERPGTRSTQYRKKGA